MHSFAAIVLTLACLAPHAVAAQEVSPSSDTWTPEQVRTAFVRSGYLVSEPISFGWIAPPVRTLRVQDGRSDRVLMVLVYSDADTAHAVSDAADLECEMGIVNVPSSTPAQALNPAPSVDSDFLAIVPLT